jgi:hypothetical protein
MMPTVVPVAQTQPSSPEPSVPHCASPPCGNSGTLLVAAQAVNRVHDGIQLADFRHFIELSLNRINCGIKPPPGGCP